MDPRPSVRVRRRRVWFSPYLLAVALSPVVLQTSTPISCQLPSGDTTLSELAVIVDGENRLDGFDPHVRAYDIALPFGTDEALVHAISTDPLARVWADVRVDGEMLDTVFASLGGGDLTIPLPSGLSTMFVWVKAPGRATGYYEVSVEIAQKSPCTEQGILDAVAAGGGPHTFDCNGPTTVVTQGEIIIDNDVILDGEGNLTIDGNDDHRVLSVEPDITAELIALTVTGGALVPDGGQGAGILSEGILTITNSSIASNGSSCGDCGVVGGGIYNSGVLTLKSSTVQENEANYGCGLYNIGTATLIKTSVSQNGRALPSSSWVSSGSGIASTGTLNLIDSVVSLNHDGRGDAAALSTYGTATLINSVVSDNYSTQSAAVSCGGSTTLVNSTVSGNAGLMTSGFECRGTLRLINSTVVALGGRSYAIRFRWEPGELIAVNSIIVGAFDSQRQRVFGCSFENIGAIAISQGGNIESVGDTCGLTDPTDLVNVSAEDLNLGPLQDNGGPTMTHELLSGSVAIDQIPEADCVDADGAPLTTDQRGFTRPLGDGCDVGAFEVQP